MVCSKHPFMEQKNSARLLKDPVHHFQVLCKSCKLIHRKNKALNLCPWNYGHSLWLRSRSLTQLLFGVFEVQQNFSIRYQRINITTFEYQWKNIQEAEERQVSQLYIQNSKNMLQMPTANGQFAPSLTSLKLNLLQQEEVWSNVFNSATGLKTFTICKKKL